MNAVRLIGTIADIDTSAPAKQEAPNVVMVLDCGDELFRVLVRFPQLVLLGTGARIGQRVVVEVQWVSPASDGGQPEKACLLAEALHVDAVGLN